jgi:hypothetical protein
MYFKNVWRAILVMFTQSKDLLSTLINGDCLLNALAGGNYNTTISARVGNFALTKNTTYWCLLERMIDLTFIPIDGPRHCFHAMLSEKKRGYTFRRSNDVGLAVLSLVVLLGCWPIMLVIQLCVLCNFLTLYRDKA